MRMLHGEEADKENALEGAFHASPQAQSPVVFTIFRSQTSRFTKSFHVIVRDERLGRGRDRFGGWFHPKVHRVPPLGTPRVAPRAFGKPLSRCSLRRLQLVSI